MRDKVINDTSTSMFLVPGLGFSLTELRLAHNFVNAYLKDGSRDHQYDFGVYLLFHPHSDTTFEQFVQRQYERPEFIEDYDHEGGFVVLVYRFPSKFEEEFKYFLKGKYSKFRKLYQALLPRLAEHTKNDPLPELSLELMICLKKVSLRSMLEERLGVDLDDGDELWPVPNNKKETLDLDKIKKQLSK